LIAFHAGVAVIFPSRAPADATDEISSSSNGLPISSKAMWTAMEQAPGE
jgi:hypothetical protein